MKVLTCALGALSLLAIAGHASAQTDPDCDSLPEPRVFIEAGDTQMTMLGELARRLRDSEEPMTLIYLPRSTCTLADNYFHARATTETMRYAPSVAEDAGWTGTARTCANKTDGHPIDLGIGATFISSCKTEITSTQPANVKIQRGPAQAYGFVVPEGQLTLGADSASGGGITWDEAYWVFSGQGTTISSPKFPWINSPLGDAAALPAILPSVYIRGAATSTLLTCASNVAPAKLPASMWSGYRKDGDLDRSTVVVNGVFANKDTSLGDGTIGILGVDVYDANRDKLDMLAFQAPNQTAGYYPDSTRALKDKRNVRDGHYVPWSYTQYIYTVDEDSQPVNPLVGRILRMVRGAVDVRLTSAVGVDPAFDMDALEVFAKKGLVPECAMQVSRERDGSDLMLCEAEEPCGCLYESVAAPELAATSEWQERCQVCDDEEPCATGTCRHGYCEAR